MKMKNFFRSMDDLRPFYKNLVLLGILMISGFLFYSLNNSMAEGLVAASLVAAALFFTRNLWTPREYRKPLLAYFSLGGFWFVTSAALTNYEKLGPILDPLILFISPFIKKLTQNVPWLKSIDVSVELINASLLVLFILLIFLINYVFRKQTVVLPHPRPLEAELPDLDIVGKIRSISQSLTIELQRIDRETNWSDYYFTPIDAEVEIISNHRREKRITDLMTALKRNKKAKAFLILGDPGSGKSVALRKLAKELLEESSDTGRVALYVNLKEWEPESPWSEKNKPTANDVYEFVLRNVKGKLDLFGNNFMDNYFEKMHSQGRFFYIIDSFDEMPAVLDVSESSWLVSDLSHAIYQFITAGVESRGLVASRLFRRPNKYFDASVILELRPLTDYKIKENLAKSEAFTDDTVFRLFHSRIDLLPLASNPFMAALLINFVKSNNGMLPSQRSELYKNYIENRLNAASEKIEHLALSKSIVTDSATEIAHLIFHRQKSGLEISMKELSKYFAKDSKLIEHVIQVLEYSKIAKVGNGHGSMFSFVHRRFNEYFVVQKMLSDDSLVTLDSIPSDSRYRDALVLYCEVAPADKAISIADFCWNLIKKFQNKHLNLHNDNNVKAVFCLRFLNEAFMMRLDCINHFRTELSNFILFQMASENLLVRKIVVEASPIADSASLEKTILIAFGTSNPVIQEAGFKAGRYLTDQSKDLDKTIIKYILQFDLVKFFGSRKELAFALKLTPTFSKVYNQFKIMQIDRFMLVLGALLSFFSISTFLTLTIVLIFKGIIEAVFEPATNAALTSQGSISKSRPMPFKAGIIARILSTYKSDFTLRLLFASTLIAASISGPIDDKVQKAREMWMIPEISSDIYFLYLVAFLVAPKADLAFYFGYVRISFYRFIQALVFISLFTFGLVEVVRYILSNVDIELILLISQVTVTVSLTFFLANSLTMYVKDKRILKKAVYFETMDRRTVSETFTSLFHKRNRMKYILTVSQKAKKARGAWPGGVIPNFEDDASSTLLLLEQKWLNLEG